MKEIKNKEFREESPLKYKPIWVRPEVYEVLKKECKYQGTFMGSDLLKDA